MCASITGNISQTLQNQYPVKINTDFQQYLKDEEYDSEALTADLKDDLPFFVEYIISKNPSIFNDHHTKRALALCVKRVDTMVNIHKAEPIVRAEENEKASIQLLNEGQESMENNKHVEAPQNEPRVADSERKEDEKWDFIYTQLQSHFSQKKKQCEQYYRAIVDILTDKEFEIDDAVVDLSGFSSTQNDSIIADCMMEKFNWQQDDANTVQLVRCLNKALADCMVEEELYEVQNNDYNIHDIEPMEWKERLTIIMALRRNAKYRSKLAKYELFSRALSVFEHRELCCLLRLWIRHKMSTTTQEFNDGEAILKFLRHRFPEKAEIFDDAQLKKLFRIGFDHRLIGHNSILRKLEPQNQVFIDLRRIQIWMIAIMMKINQYFVKYKSCHSIFCMRFLPQDASENKENHASDKVILHTKIDRAFKLLEDAEKGMISEDCWVFVIDFSKLNDSNEPQIYFESREIYDDEVISGRKYNDAFAKNQLYHLKRLDYLVCKENDNTAIALQISLHKYWNKNSVSWLTHSSGHIPFFETDIVQFIPRIFKTRTSAVTNAEWNQIVNNAKIIDLKSKDRKYAELEKCFNEFILENKGKK